MDNTTKLLIRARGFIERGWCRGATSRDATGLEVDPLNENAAMWCMAGALYAAGLPRSDPARHEHPAVHRLRDIIGSVDFNLFNDRQQTVEPVLAAFDGAISAGEALSSVAVSDSRTSRSATARTTKSVERIRLRHLRDLADELARELVGFEG